MPSTNIINSEIVRTLFKVRLNSLPLGAVKINFYIKMINYYIKNHDREFVKRFIF